MRPAIRKAILFTVLLGIVALLALDSRDDAGAKRSQAPVTTGTRDAGGHDRQERAARYALRDRAALGAPQAQLFGPQSWQPPAAKERAAPVAPRVPAMPYRYAGKVLHEGRMKIFLANGDKVFAIRPGDTLDGAYRVESIATTQITLRYLPLGRVQTIPVNSALPVAGVPGPTAPSAPTSAGGRAAASQRSAVAGNVSREVLLSAPPDAGDLWTILDDAERQTLERSRPR